MNYFFGVMSKNQVDAIIDYSLQHRDVDVTFIPSRRQIEMNGGYVNNWSTRQFSDYIKLLNPKIKLERDHGGPGQGLYDDDGFDSLREDCTYFDLIHVDPWKKYPDLTEGIKWTINMINFCYKLNPNIEYEIGTEEAIRPFTVEELETIITSVKQGLEDHIFRKIKYCVVQCGNGLCNGKNSGNFDKHKLKNMVELVNKYNFISKEHNGDWVSVNIIKQKMELGLECINIAPEFGMIESRVILNNIKNNSEHYNKIHDLCLKSEKWKKWVNSSFDPVSQRDELILITCHYIFSYDEFKEIKAYYANIDEDIREKINNKLLLLNFIYEERKNCIFCNNDSFDTCIERDYKTSLSLGMYKEIPESYFMPYNILLCNKCNAAQNKYIGDLKLVYDVNHLDNFGETKHKKHTLFSEFICANRLISNIIEIGACHHGLSSSIFEKNNEVSYTIIEPSFTGDRTNLNIINDYFENVELGNLNADTIIMSDVFEHFYNPIDILKKIQNSSIKHIYLNHPDFDYSIKNNIFINLNCEHTFLIEHSFLFKLFETYGFRLNRKVNFENFSLFIEFIRSDENGDKFPELINLNTRDNVKEYINNISLLVNKINEYIKNNQTKKFYIWPMSIHSIPLFIFGLDYKKISGVLDNSPNKIGKYIYGYNLLCSSLTDLLKSTEENICVFISGAGNYIKELDLTNTKIEIIFINEL
jgi:fructose/tagatose bisphosphate aldolase